MSKVKVSTSYILIIIIGLLFILKAVMEVLAWVGIYAPAWLTGTGIDEALSIYGGQSAISFLLGFWCLVSGIGMYRETEYAMAMALVVLSIMVVARIMVIVGWISVPVTFDAVYWPNYIIISTTVLGVLAFFRLLTFRVRYNGHGIKEELFDDRK